MVTPDEILAALRRVHAHAATRAWGSAPAETFLVDGGPATVGIVGVGHQPVLRACDRVRLTADGQGRMPLRPREADLRTLLRGGADDAAGRHWRRGRAKQRGHGIDDPAFLQPTGRCPPSAAE